MKNHNFPAIAFLLLAWASIALLTATIITGWKLTVKLWAYLNPPQLIPSTAAIYAPIFEPLSVDDVADVPISNRGICEIPPSGSEIALGKKPGTVAKSPLATTGKRSKRTLAALISEEATRKVS